VVLRQFETKATAPRLPFQGSATVVPPAQLTPPPAPKFVVPTTPVRPNFTVPTSASFKSFPLKCHLPMANTAASADDQADKAPSHSASTQAGASCEHGVRQDLQQLNPRQRSEPRARTQAQPSTNLDCSADVPRPVFTRLPNQTLCGGSSHNASREVHRRRPLGRGRP